MLSWDLALRWLLFLINWQAYKSGIIDLTDFYCMDEECVCEGKGQKWRQGGNEEFKGKQVPLLHLQCHQPGISKVA